MRQDVVAVISAHHAVLDWLTERVTEGGSGPARRVLFNEFAKALGGHVRAIDEVVIPALRANGWRNVSSCLLVGHAEPVRGVHKNVGTRGPVGIADEEQDLHQARAAARSLRNCSECRR